MATATTAELGGAGEAIAAAIGAIPDGALDWRPGGGEWSPRQIIGHVAAATDFYLAIIEGAREGGFGAVQLDFECLLPRARATEAEVARCATAPAAREAFERAHRRLLAALEGLTPEELDRPFVFLDQQPGEPPAMTTTLRERVGPRAAGHLREHQGQLASTLARWRGGSGPRPRARRRPRLSGALGRVVPVGREWGGRGMGGPAPQPDADDARRR